MYACFTLHTFLFQLNCNKKCENKLKSSVNTNIFKNLKEAFLKKLRRKKLKRKTYKRNGINSKLKTVSFLFSSNNGKSKQPLTFCCRSIIDIK